MFFRGGCQKKSSRRKNKLFLLSPDTKYFQFHPPVKRPDKKNGKITILLEIEKFYLKQKIMQHWPFGGFVCAFIKYKTDIYIVDLHEPHQEKIGKS